MSADVKVLSKIEMVKHIWEYILDDHFMTSMKEGTVLKCNDHVTRRVFPRIHYYSADMPEK